MKRKNLPLKKLQIIIGNLREYEGYIKNHDWSDRHERYLRDTKHIEVTPEYQLLKKTIQKIRALFSECTQDCLGRSKIKKVLQNGKEQPLQRATGIIHREMRRIGTHPKRVYFTYIGTASSNLGTLYCFSSLQKLNSFVEKKKLLPICSSFGPLIIVNTDKETGFEIHRETSPCEYAWDEYINGKGRMFMMRVPNPYAFLKFSIIFLEQMLDLSKAHTLKLFPYLLTAYAANWPKNSSVGAYFRGYRENFKYAFPRAEANEVSGEDIPVVLLPEDRKRLEKKILELSALFTITDEPVAHRIEPQVTPSDGIPVFLYRGHSAPWEDADALVRFYDDLCDALREFGSDEELGFSHLVDNIDFSACDELLGLKLGLDGSLVDSGI